MSFDERLNNWMKENKIKQKDIAERASVDKSYISNIVNGKQTPSDNIIEVLSSMSGYSSYWWKNGKEENDNLNSLNTLLNTLIISGDISKDGSYDEYVESMIKTMINREIKLKLKNQNKTVNI